MGVGEYVPFMLANDMVTRREVPRVMQKLRGESDDGM